MEEFYIITFNTTNFAMQAESMIKGKNIPQQIIPTPRQITLSCGLSIKFSGQYLNEICEMIKGGNIQVKAMYSISGELGERKIKKIEMK